MESCRELRRAGGANFPLPPPPPPPPPLLPLCTHGQQTSRRPRNRQSSGSSVPWWKAWMRKYVILCLVCGGLSVVLGIVLIVIYLLLRSYTSSLQFFETVPTYVPGVVLIITGLIVMCFAKRKNRYAYLIKLAGGCCLICALLCVVITVTTTVVHMNRLQTLHECVYTPQAKTCMCVSAIADHTTQDAHRFVFNNTPNCEVVHGSLYSCLRALFSFSVIGILVCIFSSMLVYQLLSHEKKKVYWQQLELRRRFLYQRNPHHAMCGCYEDLYPWQLWEMLDYRFLTSHSLTPTPIGGEEELPSQNNGPTSRGVGVSGGGGHRASGWNWLPWPRHDSTRGNPSSSRSSNPSRQSFMRRLMSRDSWNQQLLTLGSCNPEDPSNQVDSPGVSPWRSECIHIFRPGPRSGSCVPPIRFGIRARNSPYGRPQSGHRRTRSNDGVFHHLHMAPRYSHPYPIADANSSVACHFSNCEIPRYMWGPPPPYSHPPSIENLPACDGNNANHNSRRSSSSRDAVNGGLEISHCEQVITALEPSGTGTLSSKSTPLSERRFMCHNFSSEGITLTIGSNFSDICSDDRGNKQRKSEEKCIVEVHVPYILHKNNLVFNTLPARSCRKKEINPFKSLSNIPLCLSRRLNSLKQEKNQAGHLSVIQNCCSHKDELNCPLNKVIENDDAKPRFCNVMTLKTLSEQQLYEGNSTNTSPITETSPSSLSYHPTMVEIPSDFRSSLVIATSPSTPVTENPTLTDMIYAQSMPNLSLSNSQTVCSIHRVPSSGNTSTSQDFADFDLEEDSSPIILCSPISDIPPPPSLPDDSTTDSSSSYYPCPPPLKYMESNEVPFLNESGWGSRHITVNCIKKHSALPVISSNGGGSIELVSDAVNRTNEGFETDRELLSSVSSSHNNHPIIPFSTSSSVTVNNSDFETLTNCGIHHHRHPRQKAVHGVPENARGSAFRTLSQERTNNFVVTIKSVNV